jgi:hypothetical protein
MKIKALAQILIKQVIKMLFASHFLPSNAKIWLPIAQSFDHKSG